MSYTRNIKALLAGTTIFAVTGALPAAVAAQDVAQDQAPLVMAQAASFDDETIDAFVAAQAEVEEIRSVYAQQYQAAETEEQREQIDQTAVQEMAEAVRETPNITVEEYDAVIQAANQDQALLQRIQEAMADAPT